MLVRMYARSRKLDLSGSHAWFVRVLVLGPHTRGTRLAECVPSILCVYMV